MRPELSDRRFQHSARQKAWAILIHGLRRSGTTIVWETLRTSPALRCYDEPFHPRFASGDRENAKGTWREMAQARDDAGAHGITPALISPSGELDADTTAEQKTWLGYLAQSQHRVVIDMVRCWNRLPGLYPPGLSAVTVHLVRDPASWIAAHLVPSGAPTPRRRIAGLYRRGSFFHRRGFYDNYQYQEIIETALDRQHPVMSHVAVPMAELKSAPAYIKLLAFWWGANLTLRRAILAHRLPAITVSLSDFSQAPAASVDAIRTAAGWAPIEVSVDRVRPTGVAFAGQDPRWSQAAVRLGLPAELFRPEGRTAAAIENALDRAAQGTLNDTFPG
jgi:hypothetical protein